MCQAKHYGKFKVPTVRNVAVTALCMHNQYFTSLRAVVDFHSTRDVQPRCAGDLVSEAEAPRLGCWPQPDMVTNVNADELGSLRLTPGEVDAIVAFTQTLADGWQPNVRRVARRLP